MLDLRDKGIRVATVMPGSVATGFAGRSPDDGEEWKLSPEDVAEAVLAVVQQRSQALAEPDRAAAEPASGEASAGSDALALTRGLPPRLPCGRLRGASSSLRICWDPIQRRPGRVSSPEPTHRASGVAAVRSCQFSGYGEYLAPRSAVGEPQQRRQTACGLIRRRDLRSTPFGWPADRLQQAARGVLRRFRLNAIVAYTAAGIVLGPITGIVNPAGEVHVLLGVGIFLFFFLIGLDELDISGFLAAIRGRCSLAAVVSVVASLLAALVVTFNIGFDFGLGLDFAGSLAVAGVLSLTSLGVLAKVLIDEGKLRSPIGIEMFTTALIAELLVLLVVGFSVGEHAAHPTPSGMLMLLGQIAGFVVVTGCSRAGSFRR